MAGFFLIPYERHDTLSGLPARRIAMTEYLAAINADGGAFREAECLGNQAIVKVRASAATLALMAADARYTRIPAGAMDDPVSGLTAGQQNAIQQTLLNAGYTASELNAAFPGGFNGPYTIRDVLRFLLTRRLESRHDVASDTIILDGPVQACETPESVDAAVAGTHLP